MARAAVDKPLDCPDYKSLCVQAERSGGIDLKSGTAVMEGNVVGYIKEQELAFKAEALKAFRNEQNDWTRLVLDRQVHLTRTDSTADADHAVIEKARVLLVGNGRLEQPPYSIRGGEIDAVDQTGVITVRGAPSAPARIQYRTAPAMAEETPGTGPEAPENILAQATEAVVYSKESRLKLFGEASIHRWQLDWRLTSRTADLDFGEDQTLERFRAEGDVKIVQPGRSLSSDVAWSRNNNEIIVLVGNAKVQQQGEFQLSSDRLEVYTDAKRGVVQSTERQQPVKLAFDLAKQKPLRLERKDMDEMKTQGIPAAMLLKLEPILGVSYPSREEFDAAVLPLLTEREAKAYLETLARRARKEAP